MILQNSRFVDSNVVTSTVHGKPAQVVASSAPKPYTFAFTSYQLVQGDTLDTLSQKYFNDPELWWVIADANPEVLLWYPVPVGMTIRIPSAALQ